MWGKLRWKDSRVYLSKDKACVSQRREVLGCGAAIVKKVKSGRGEWPFARTSEKLCINITIHYSLFTIHYSLFTLPYTLHPTPSLTDSPAAECRLTGLRDGENDPFGLQRIDDFLISVPGWGRLRDRVKPSVRLELRRR